MPSRKITAQEIEIYKNKYKEYLKESKNENILYFFKINNTTVTIYKNGTLFIQGNPLDEYENEKDDYPYDLASTIGADEVGTGDLFGPIVACSCYVSKDKVDKLTKLGVKDSKKLCEKKIIEIAKKLIEICPYEYYVLSNERINAAKDSYNLNEIKAYLHNHNIKLLKNKCKYDYIVLDDFCGKENYEKYLKGEAISDIIFEAKGESKSIAVAASSIIARYYFLNAIKELESKYSYKIPLGSSNKKTQELIDKIKSDGNEEVFNHIAKLSFKNLKN